MAASGPDLEAHLALAIDAGVNLVGPHFPDPDSAVRSASSFGVCRLLCISNTEKCWAPASEVCARFPGQVVCTAGVHPQEVKAVQKMAPGCFERLLTEQCRTMYGCVAVGECGLDCSSATSKPKRSQLVVFETQVKVAKALGKPLYLHCRHAHDSFLQVLKEVDYFSGVVHCFTGTVEEASDFVRLGLYVGISGLLMNPARNACLEEALSTGVIPLSRVLVETDAPWMSVESGRHSEPRDVHVVYRRIAQLTRTPVGHVYAIVAENFSKLFSVPVPTPVPLTVGTGEREVHDGSERTGSVSMMIGDRAVCLSAMTEEDREEFKEEARKNNDMFNAMFGALPEDACPDGNVSFEDILKFWARPADEHSSRDRSAAQRRPGPPGFCDPL